MKKTIKIFIPLLIAVIIVSVFALSSCGSGASGIELINVRPYQNTGVDYNYCTFGFFYSREMLSNYYEVKVEYNGTSYYIQEDYFFFQYAYNVNNTKMRVADSTVFFGVQLLDTVKQVKVTLCRCNTKSSNDGFEILEKIYTQTYNIE